MQHIGTPQYWKNKYYTLKAISKYMSEEYGKDHPDLFVTLTHNENDELCQLIN